MVVWLWVGVFVVLGGGVFWMGACDLHAAVLPFARSVAVLAAPNLRRRLSVADPRFMHRLDENRLVRYAAAAVRDNRHDAIACVRQLCGWITAFAAAVRYFHEHRCACD